MNCTPEQRDAIAAQGKIIVSASAGSGKTFVMIQKICDLLQSGGDLTSVLAVTFTKKAAAQIKDKLRKTLIARLAAADGEERANIKRQLSLIPSADISTIHSFCARLIRTHFYAAGVDRSFEIVVDEAKLAELKERAMDELFDRLYDEEDGDLIFVLDRLRRKRTDAGVRKLIAEALEKARNTAGYEEMLKNSPSVFCCEGFDRVCADLSAFTSRKCAALAAAFDQFYAALDVPPAYAQKLDAVAEGIRAALAQAAETDIFAPLPPLSPVRRPPAKDDGEKAAAAQFDAYRKKLKDRYDRLRGDIADRQTEYEAFIECGKLAAAFSRLVLQFDEQYAAVKREENKLDCPDLEHMTLKLLADERIKRGVNERYRHVFVDEYQDVNPVQERILTLVGAADVFTVGDVKQAIYGFRGSKSVFFSQKYADMLLERGAKKLSVNFRSSDGVLGFVNRLFGDIMTPLSCGIDYAADGVMHRGGKFPEGYGRAGIVVFGKDERRAPAAEGVYSVLDHGGGKAGHTREGLAVLEIVRRELSGRHYSPEKGCMVDTQPGDICILTRKNAGDSTLGIVRALTDAGYGVDGAGDGNLLNRPEIKQLLDILSLIDNCQQDIPLTTAMLSPVGGFTHDELARIRIAQNGAPGMTFRDCLVAYYKYMRDDTAAKAGAFFAKINAYRRLSDILGAAALIDRILSDTGLAARYAADGGAKLAAVRRLKQEAFTGTGELQLNAFLTRIKCAGSSIKAAPRSSADSIKVMTMHSSKGLEFPVVIVADIARRFRKEELEEMPFDDEYAFCPRTFDRENKLVRSNVLRELCLRRARREEIKNELNLFYVACTRAMCNLYVLCGEPPAYDPAAWYEADCYAKMFDVTKYSPEYAEAPKDFEDAVRTPPIISAKGAAAGVDELFGKQYPHAVSVELPVKTSASQLMRESERTQPEAYAAHYLFNDEYGDEEPGGREAGTAYHRYLELCDLNVRDEEGILRELDRLTAEGKLSPEQRDMLSADRLAGILAMPVFARLAGARIFREREFLCALPARDVLDTAATDKVLVQGAIDLLAESREGLTIVDYKYVSMPQEAMLKKYTRQLELYKKAVAMIESVDESTIAVCLVDLKRRREFYL